MWLHSITPSFEIDCYIFVVGIVKIRHIAALSPSVGYHLGGIGLRHLSSHYSVVKKVRGGKVRNAVIAAILPNVAGVVAANYVMFKLTIGHTSTLAPSEPAGKHCVCPPHFSSWVELNLGKIFHQTNVVVNLVALVFVPYLIVCCAQHHIFTLRGEYIKQQRKTVAFHKMQNHIRIKHYLNLLAHLFATYSKSQDSVLPKSVPCQTLS